MYNNRKSAGMVNKKTKQNLHNKYLVKTVFGKWLNIRFSSKISL